MSTKLLRAVRRSRSSFAAPVLLEALESRTLLSAAVAGTVAAAPRSASVAQAVVVPTGPIGLTNSIVSSTLPASLTFTKGSKAFKVQVNVANNGTGTTGKGSKVTVTAVLHPTSGADVVIGTKSQAYTKVAGGTGSKTVTVTVKVPTTLTAGSYTLETSVSASGFTPTSSNVATGSAISISSSPTTGGASYLGKLGNVIRLTDLIESSVSPVPGAGTTTTTHWHFVDEKNQTGELFLIQNVGLLAKAADATINFFPDNALGAGSVILKGQSASAAAAVGTTFTFGKSGSIAVTTDSYTGSTCKVSRTG